MELSGNIKIGGVTLRKIKFRGKSIDSDSWVCGYYIHDIEKDTHDILCIYNNKQYIVEVTEKTVGQYTDLKDKKGKEIYEGDIYHVGDKNIRYVVVWDDTGLIGKQLGSSSYVGLSYWQERMEIIGNIYDTPELISS